MIICRRREEILTGARELGTVMLERHGILYHCHHQRIDWIYNRYRVFCRDNTYYNGICIHLPVSKRTNLPEDS